MSDNAASGEHTCRRTAVALAFGITALASLGLAVHVLRSAARTRLEGVLLAVALGGLGLRVRARSRKHLLPQGPYTEEREPLASSRRGPGRASPADFERGEGWLHPRRGASS